MANTSLNDLIEKKIEMWYGTAFGYQLKNMYENGAIEEICSLLDIDPEDYE